MGLGFGALEVGLGRGARSPVPAPPESNPLCERLMVCAPNVGPAPPVAFPSTTLCRAGQPNVMSHLATPRATGTTLPPRLASPLSWGRGQGAARGAGGRPRCSLWWRGCGSSPPPPHLATSTSGATAERVGWGERGSRRDAPCLGGGVWQLHEDDSGRRLPAGTVLGSRRAAVQRPLGTPRSSQRKHEFAPMKYEHAQLSPHIPPRRDRPEIIMWV